MLANEPAWQNSADYSPSFLQARVIRWTKLVLRIHFIFWLQPFSECFLQGLNGVWFIQKYLDWKYAFIFYAIHIVFWYLLDYLQLQAIEVFNLF